MKKFFLKLLLVLIILTIYRIDGTNSYLVDNEISTNNTIQAATWDATPPTITDISYLIASPYETNNLPKATITWNTDENATGNLEYKTNPEDPWTQIEPEDITADNTFHSQEIVGLLSNTTYYYQVKSKDMANNEAVSLTYSFTTGNMNSGDPVLSDIVINEFLPDPNGTDNAPMPSGEWVELYNNGLGPQDLTGWSLSLGSNPGYKLDLTPTNTTSMDIAPGAFAVVYRNGDPLFEMLNTGDTVQLRDSTNVVIDQYTYTGLQIAENKSIARFPDGSDSWFDPIPTPGGPNMLEVLPLLKMSLVNDKKAVLIKVMNLKNYSFLSYELTYKAYDIEKGAIGSGVDITGKTEFNREIDLATCSNEVCTYDQNVHDIKLKITLSDPEGKETILNL